MVQRMYRKTNKRGIKMMEFRTKQGTTSFNRECICAYTVYVNSQNQRLIDVHINGGSIFTVLAGSTKDFLGWMNE
tara:strand:+ start:685 stop:909 length:225 start_codon:yes stop_codon:yes gene_type:complete